MAFTGDLENLHIVDIIQLIHTTRKSGTFSVTGSKGESRIIFSNGYIVGANHLNNKVRIGSVLVKMKAISLEDLRLALEAQKKAGKGRKPLISTLIGMGKLKQEDAFKGLKKLIDMTIVELIGWTKGTFSLDTSDIMVTPECAYPISKMEQELSVDAQMVLMDSLRLFDEKERDRAAGKDVPSDEELFVEALPGEETTVSVTKKSSLTADDLGLGDLEHLERKMPQSLSIEEIFDPFEIHRQKIKEMLPGFSEDEQQAFVSFLKKATSSIDLYDVSKRQEGRTNALIVFSSDELVRYSLMTACKSGGLLVFATDKEEELDRIVAQCSSITPYPVIVFDSPETDTGVTPPEKIVALRGGLMKKYPQLRAIQMASLSDLDFMLNSFNDGVKAVFPKPSRKTGKKTFIKDMIKLFQAFKSYIDGLAPEQTVAAGNDDGLARLKDFNSAIMELNDPTDVSYTILQFMAGTFERCITFIVRKTELIGEISVGVNSGKDSGPAPAGKLKIPLTKPSIFKDLAEKGQLFCGESNDEVLREHLFNDIGAPLSPAIILLPIKNQGKTVAIIYGDFSNKKPSPVKAELFGILSAQSSLALENILYRKNMVKGHQK